MIFHIVVASIILILQMKVRLNLLVKVSKAQNTNECSNQN